MRRLRRAKIVATLGPASSSPDMIARLFKAGADVFRINMSHTSQDRMRELVGMIRAVERDTGRPIGVLVDLQGPKLRLGTFTGGSVTVKSRRHASCSTADTAPGDADARYLPHPEIFATIKPGHALLIDDGKVKLTVTEAEPKRIATRVVVGGKLSDRKGVSLPDTTNPVFGADRQRPLGSRSRARDRHRLGGAVVHPAAGGSSPRQRRSRAAAPR